MSHTLIYSRATIDVSESAALHGHKALTPIISGLVCGSFIALAWAVGFIVFYVKRREHETAARALGYKSYKDFIVSKPALNSTRYYIPADPAVDRRSDVGMGTSEPLIEEEMEEDVADDRTERIEMRPRSDMPEPGSPASQQLFESLVTPSSTTLLVSSWLGSQSSPDDISTESNRDSDSQYIASYRGSGL